MSGHFWRLKLDQWRFLTTIRRLDIYKQGIREIFIPSFPRPRYSLKQSGRKRKNRRQEARINNIPLAGKGNRIPTPTEWLMSTMQLGDAQPQQQQQQLFYFFSFLIKHISRVYSYSYSALFCRVIYAVRVKLFLRLLTGVMCYARAISFIVAQLFEFPLLLKSTRLNS